MLLRAVASPTTITVGDRVSLTITVAYGGPVEPAETRFGPTAGDYEILSAESSEPKPGKEGRLTMTHRLQLTTFSTGTVTVPPIPVYFRRADGSFLEARTDALPITVTSILAKAGDAGGLRPLKGLYNVRSWTWLWVLLGAAALALLAWAWTRRGKGGTAAAGTGAPRLSPEDEANQALDALANEPLTDDTAKERYFRLSEILRRYIERRYPISALEMTTSELLRALRGLDLPLTASLTLREFLENADLVKFAKVTPTPEQVATDMGYVRSFIEATTPRPAEPDAAKAEEPPL